MEIKCKETKDVEQIVSLHKQIFCEDNKLFFENLKEKKYYRMFVATHNNQSIAYCIMSEIDDQAEIINIGTLKEYRGNGVAKQLLNCAINLLEAKELFLEVATQNKSGIALYKACGFVEIGRRKKYYGDDDAIVMKKQKILT